MVEPIALAERVEAWQKRLGPLGIDHWRIEVITVGDDDEVTSRRDAIASAGVSTHYESVRFFFRGSYLEDCSLRDLDETIVHEWLHVVGRDLDFAYSELDEWFPLATWDLVLAGLNHARESEIERLARLIVSLWYAPAKASNERLDLLYRTNQD